MAEKRCQKCHMLYPEEELLVREDNGASVCEDCSGLLDGEELGCRYVESG